MTTIDRTCDICRINVGADTPATWDAPTITGPWAYLCDSHHDTHGLPGGTNLAELERRQNATFDDRKEELLNALDRGDMDAAWDAIGDGDILDFI